ISRSKLLPPVALRPGRRRLTPLGTRTAQRSACCARRSHRLGPPGKLRHLDPIAPLSSVAWKTCQVVCRYERETAPATREGPIATAYRRIAPSSSSLHFEVSIYPATNNLQTPLARSQKSPR